MPVSCVPGRGEDTSTLLLPGIARGDSFAAAEFALGGADFAGETVGLPCPPPFAPGAAGEVPANRVLRAEYFAAIICLAGGGVGLPGGRGEAPRFIAPAKTVTALGFSPTISSREACSPADSPPHQQYEH